MRNSTRLMMMACALVTGLNEPPPPSPSTFFSQFHMYMAICVADLGNHDIDFLPNFFIGGSIGVIRAVELHRVSTLTSPSLIAAPFVYLAIAAIFPSALAIFVSVHVLRALVLAFASILQMMIARQTVRGAVKPGSRGGGTKRGPVVCVRLIGMPPLWWW